MVAAENRLFWNAKTGHLQTISPLEGEMPRQGQRGVNPFNTFGASGSCRYPSLSLSRHLPLKGGDCKVGLARLHTTADAAQPLTPLRHAGLDPASSANGTGFATQVVGPWTPAQGRGDGRKEMPKETTP